MRYSNIISFTGMKKLLILTLALATGVTLYAQDRIYKRSGEILEVRIIEVGDFEVKYKQWDNPEGVTYVMEGNMIRKILFEDGTTKTFDADLLTPIKYADQRKNAYKVSFLDPLLGSIQFTYEKHIKPGRSMEFSLGYIGVGGDPEYEKPLGFNLRYGYKISRTPDFYVRNMKSAHVLRGAYIRPDIAVSVFEGDYTNWRLGWNAQKERANYVAGAFMINFGEQIVYDNIFVVDTYIGFGYGFVSSSKNWKETGDYIRWNYGFLAGAVDVPIAINFGIRVGFASGK